MVKVKQKINMMLSEVAGCNLIYENINGNPIDFFHHSTSFIYHKHIKHESTKSQYKSHK